MTLGSSPGMICKRVAINYTLMIVQFPYFDYFVFVIGKLERTALAAMMHMRLINHSWKLSRYHM